MQISYGTNNSITATCARFEPRNRPLKAHLAVYPKPSRFCGVPRRRGHSSRAGATVDDHARGGSFRAVTKEHEQRGGRDERRERTGAVSRARVFVLSNLRARSSPRSPAREVAAATRSPRARPRARASSRPPPAAARSRAIVLTRPSPRSPPNLRRSRARPGATRARAAAPEARSRARNTTAREVARAAIIPRGRRRRDARRRRRPRKRTTATTRRTSRARSSRSKTRGRARTAPTTPPRSRWRIRAIPTSPSFDASASTTSAGSRT
jgi:hypothetical protein